MATNFPTSIDALTNPSSGDTLASPDHASQHANANDAIEALQTKVGVNGSAVTTSLEYRVTAASAQATPTTYGTVKGFTGDYAPSETFYGFGKSPWSITITNPSGTTLVLTINGGDTWSSILASGPTFTPANEFIVGRVVDITDGGAGTNWVTGGVVSSFTSNTLTVSSYTSTDGGTVSDTTMIVIFPAVSVDGFGNTFFGNKAGVGLGSYSLYTTDNVAIGKNAMSKNTANDDYNTERNIAIGAESGNDFKGYRNIFIGYQAGNDIEVTGAKRNFFNNIFIGSRTGSAALNNLSGATIIGFNMTGNGVGGDDTVTLGKDDMRAVVAKGSGDVQFPTQGYHHVRRNSSLSYNNSAQNVTVVFNSYVAATGSINYSYSTGKITAQHAGIYSVSCSVYGMSDVAQLWLVINGVREESIAVQTTTNLVGHGLAKLAAGDTLGVAAWFNGAAGTILNYDDHTFLKIRYLG